MTKIWLKATMLVPVLLLTACGGEPSEAEMKAAIQAQFDGANQFISGLGRSVGSSTNLKLVKEIKSFKKHECRQKQDSNAYVCSLSISYDSMMGEVSNTSEMTFLKGENGWVLVD